MNRIDVPCCVANLAQQPQHLGLHGDVERRRRLVGDQQLRLEAQAHGDHGALLHAAGKLVRDIPRRAVSGSRRWTARRKLDGLPLRGRPRRRAMQRQRLADLRADAQASD